MKKITIIAKHSEKETVLKTVQELQKMELVDLETLEEKSELLTYYQRDDRRVNRKELEEKLRLIQETQAYLQAFLPIKGGMKKLKEGRKSYTLVELEQRIEKSSILTVCEEIKTIEIELRELDQLRKRQNEAESFLKKWQKLGFSPKNVDDFRYFVIKVGTVSIDSGLSLKLAIAQQKNSYFEEVYQTRDELGCMIVVDEKDLEAIEKILHHHHFMSLKYGYKLAPKEELVKLQTESAELIQRQNELKKQIEGYQDQVDLLQLGEEYYGNLVQREIAQSLLMNGTRLFILNGWLEEAEISELIEYLKQDVPEDSFVIMDDEIQETEVPHVPTVLKNNPVVAPFETLTEMYSMPKYDDVDPTPLLMPFYMVFFGMMVADVGYGLILLLATLAAQKLFNLDKGLRKNMRFFYLLSYPTIIWGLIYGSFFGYALPFNVLNPQKDVNAILITSVVFGFIQLLFGLCINGTILIRKKKPIEGYVESFSWVGILGGIGLIVLGMLVFNQSIITLAGSVLVGINVVGLLVFSAVQSENKLLGFGGGLYALYGITGYVGDLVSYTRLMALGIAGGSIAQAFNLIIDLFPPVGKFTIGLVLFALLHAINIFLSFLSAYVHGARLQYVEFFGKFYQGGGRGLKPFKTFEKHIYLKKRNSVKTEVKK
ncbi:V-type ATP synthase subunit I [Carnobacterium gallinarum]|uniref:V-type ATP synthase subunit I n=1 Tax=Carnobacterium gallinarum TaxID=2749 RepID=UPI001FE01E5A|nr:V-type ATP synthase subunit I [Carnobacterium gallinarum]